MKGLRSVRKGWKYGFLLLTILVGALVATNLTTGQEFRSLPYLRNARVLATTKQFADQTIRRSWQLEVSPNERAALARDISRPGSRWEEGFLDCPTATLGDPAKWMIYFPSEFEASSTAGFDCPPGKTIVIVELTSTDPVARIVAIFGRPKPTPRLNQPIPFHHRRLVALDAR